MFLMSVKNLRCAFWLSVACGNSRFPSLLAAENVSREKSPAAGGEEKQHFSQARFSGSEFRLKEVVCVCLCFSYTRRDIFILAEI